MTKLRPKRSDPTVFVEEGVYSQKQLINLLKKPRKPRKKRRYRPSAALRRKYDLRFPVVRPQVDVLSSSIYKKEAPGKMVVDLTGDEDMVIAESKVVTPERVRHSPPVTPLSQRRESRRQRRTENLTFLYPPDYFSETLGDLWISGPDGFVDRNNIFYHIDDVDEARRTRNNVFHLD